jgi:hypothetical protein
MDRLTIILILGMLLTSCGKKKIYDRLEIAPSQSKETRLVDKKPTFTRQDSNVSCQEGEVATKEDAEKGIIGYYFWGIAIPPIAHTLESKYGFKIYTQGCVLNASWSCYNEYMDKVIMQKYKQDVIAIELAKEHKKLEQQLHN